MAPRVLALGQMKQRFPAATSRFRLCHLSLVIFTITWMGCSKSEVQVVMPPTPPPATNSVPLTIPLRPSAAERLVEIDRSLALPLTGRPDESDRRSLLRAEREALVASGQVPYRMQAQVAANRNSAVQSVPANLPTSTQRLANGDIVNYAQPVSQNGRITIAPNSQTSNLSYLEQMTPTERERYYKAMRLQNSRRVEIDVHHR
jgi:hypothetical protein